MSKDITPEGCEDCGLIWYGPVTSQQHRDLTRHDIVHDPEYDCDICEKPIRYDTTRAVWLHRDPVGPRTHPAAAPWPYVGIGNAVTYMQGDRMLTRHVSDQSSTSVEVIYRASASGERRFEWIAKSRLIGVNVIPVHE